MKKLVMLLVVVSMLVGCSASKSMSPFLKSDVFRTSLQVAANLTFAKHPEYAATVVRFAEPLVLAASADETTTLGQFRDLVFSRIDYTKLSSAEIAALQPLFQVLMSELDRIIDTEGSWMTYDSTPFRGLAATLLDSARLYAGMQRMP